MVTKHHSSSENGNSNHSSSSPPFTSEPLPWLAPSYRHIYSSEDQRARTADLMIYMQCKP
eukprot:8788223-Pyramimonas_sp.AAC.1